MKLPRALVPVLNSASLAAGVLAAVMAVFVAVTALRLQAVDPLASPALAELRRELAARPSDEARVRDIRAMELEARTAYFTARQRIDTGAVILAVAFAIFAAGLRAAAYIKKTIPDPASAVRVPASASGSRTRTALAVGGATLAAAVCLASVLSTRNLPEDARHVVNAVGLGGYPSKQAFAENWPSFRGPSAGAVPADAEGAAAFGSGNLSVLWRVPAGLPGSSSAAVWGSRVFVTGATSESQEISCFDADGGALVWRRSVRELLGADQPSPEVSRDTGWAAPTPACDGKRVFVMFASGQLLALSMDGRLLWNRDFGVPENPYGIASSPVVWRDQVIVQFDQSNMGLVAAFQTGTGRLIWQHVRTLRPSWATPLVVEEPEWTGLIVVGNPFVEALDLETGRAIWSADCMSGETAPSAAYTNGTAFAATALASAFAIACAPQADLKPGDIAWSYQEDLPDTSSPIAVNGRLYLASSMGTVSCLDAASGTLLWKHQYEGRISSSPIAAGGTVFVADLSGVLHGFRESETFSPLADMALGAAVTATPAFHRGRLYVRAGSDLVCIGGAP